MFKRWQLYALCASLAFIAGALSFFEKTYSLDLLLFDFSQTINKVPQNNNIVIIEIDDKSLKEIGRWPWDRSIHAQLLNILHKAEAKAVAYDVIFAEQDLNNPASDSALSLSLTQNTPLVLPIYIEQTGIEGQLLEVLPHPNFITPKTVLGHVHVYQSNDGVARGVFLKEGVGEPYWPHFSLALYNKINHLPYTLTGQTIPYNNASPSPFIIARNHLNLIPVDTHNQTLHISFSDIINNKINLDTFKNKVIFVGATATGLGDIITTSIGPMYGIDYNVWAYKAIENKQFIHTPNRYILASLHIVLTFLVTVWLSTFQPKWFLFTTITLLVVTQCIVITLQNIGGIWLPLSSFSLSIMVFYPLWSWQKLELALAFLKTEKKILNDTSTYLEYTSNNISSRTHLLNLATHLQQSKFLTDFTINNETINTVKQPLNKPLVDINNNYLSISIPQYQLTGLLDNTLLEGKSSVQQINLLIEQYFEKRDNTNSSKADAIELLSTMISHLKKVKKSDNSNKKMMLTTLSNLSDGVIVSDMFGSVRYVNNTFFTMMNQEPTTEKTLLGLLECVSLANEEAWPKILSLLAFSNNQYASQAMHMASGKEFLFQACSAHIYNDFPDTLIFTFTDITLIKEAEKAKIEAMNFLSHDLRAPMVSILSTIELNKNAQNIELMDQIASLVKKNLHYADSYLSLSKAKSANDEQFYMCDMHHIIDSAHSLALALAKDKNLSVVVQKIDDDAWVMGDNDLLERALNNYVTNAIKYSEPNTSIFIRMFKKPHLETHVRQIVIEVEDQGIGIEEQDQDTLFDKFVRVKNQYKKGSGLGLYFVKTVINRHKGSVQVSSQKGKGSLFSLAIPEHLETDDHNNNEDVFN